MGARVESRQVIGPIGSSYALVFSYHVVIVVVKNIVQPLVLSQSYLAGCTSSAQVVEKQGVVGLQVLVVHQTSYCEEVGSDRGQKGEYIVLLEGDLSEGRRLHGQGITGLSNVGVLNNYNSTK